MFELVARAVSNCTILLILASCAIKLYCTTGEELAHSNSPLLVMTIEPGRSKAYSNDITWRMVYQRCGLGLSYKQIGEQLNVDPSTVCRTVQLFEETGTVHSIQGYH